MSKRAPPLPRFTTKLDEDTCDLLSYVAEIPDNIGPLEIPCNKLSIGCFIARVDAAEPELLGWVELIGELIKARDKAKRQLTRK
jgi:hypothetical protein